MPDNQDLSRSGATYINRIRLSLTILYIASVIITFSTSTLLQNTIYIVAIGFMILYGCVFWLWNRVRRVPDWVARLFVLLDMLVVITTMSGGMVSKVGAQDMLENIILYFIIIFYILYSAYLLSPRFTLSVAALAALGSVLLSILAYQAGIQYSNSLDKAVTPGYSSLTREILKPIFIFAAGILTYLMLRITRSTLSLADKQRHNAESTLAQIKANAQKSAQSAQELDEALKGLSDFMSDFKDTVNDHAATFEEISASMEEYAASNERSAESVHTQFQKIEGLNRRSQSIKSANQSIEDNSSQLQERLSDARAASQAVNSTMVDMDQFYSALIETFKKVSEVTGIMSDVSEQTNLLALNASIEAARAGEAGRGFAVVADEVSRLAETSSKNARTISETIHKSSIQIESGKQSLKDALAKVGEQDRAFQEALEMFKIVSVSFSNVQSDNQDIWNNLQELRDLSAEIETSSREQKQGSQEITRSLEGLDKSFNLLVERSAAIDEYLNKIKTQSEMLRDQQ